MKTSIVAVLYILTVSLALAFAAPIARASGTIGIYGIVEKVVFEPNEQAPERVRVYGAFAFYNELNRSRPVGAASTPRINNVARGYLYFELPYREGLHDVVRREWADLAAAAATGEAVGFASYGYMGPFVERFASAAPEVLVAAPVSEYPEALRELAERSSGGVTYTGMSSANLVVWPAAESAATPVPYQTAGVGVARLGEGNYDDVVAKLRAALDP